jgi:hypothetical protein
VRKLAELFTAAGRAVPRRSAAAQAATLLLSLGALVSCGPPAAGALGGAPLPAMAVPPTHLAPGYRLIAFRWEYVEENQLTRGDGAVRLAAPDSARLDLFVAGLGGSAFLIGDALYAPLPPGAQRLVPPATMLWAAFGRLSVPAASDTVVRQIGDVIRADIGEEPVWRASFRENSLVRLEHIAGGRIVEWVEREGTRVRYTSNAAPRRLTLTITRDEPSEPFDPAIWHP